MNITQADIAQLDDDSCKRLVAMYHQIHEDGGQIAGFAHALSMALVAALRERRRLWLLLEFELMNHDGPGSLVGPDDDPIAEAREELRRAVRRDAGEEA